MIQTRLFQFVVSMLRSSTVLVRRQDQIHVYFGTLEAPHQAQSSPLTNYFVFSVMMND